MAMIVKKRRDGYAVLYNGRVLACPYHKRAEAVADAQGMKRLLAADSDLLDDMNKWARGELCQPQQND